jgi:hypothetical protein
MFVVAVVVVTAAAGCGRVAPESAVVLTGATVYAATVNESSADVHVTYAFTTGNRSVGATGTESGPVSWSAGQGELTMTMTMAAAARYRLTTRQIIDGNHTYSKVLIKGLPASALAGIPGLTGWTETTWSGKSSADLSGNLIWDLFVSMASPSGLSPSSLLGLLRAKASTVLNLGGEVLDGIHTTHYRALIPLSRLGGGTAADLQEAEQALGTAFLGIDYWTDSSDVLRQLSLAITARRAPRATTSTPGELTLPISYPVTMSVSLRLSNYGIPVHVVPPPPAEITSRESCVNSRDGFSCQ